VPVRDLTERPQIPRLGKVRLGDQSGTNGAPVNQPHFVVPPEVQAIYGEKPTELNVVFLSDDLEKIASQYYRAYNKSNGLICKGDGFRADAILDESALRKNGGELNVEAWAHGTQGTMVRQNIACAGAGYEGAPPCPMYAAKKCGIRGFYQFAIKDVPGLGVYQMDTGSMVSIRKMNGAIELSRQLLGGVAGIPMKLKRVQEEVSPDGKKKKVWMVMLEVDTGLSLTKLMELHSGPVAQALLPPVDESDIYDAIDEDVIEGEVVSRDPEPPATPTSPSALLNAIGEAHGIPVMLQAKGIMKPLYGVEDFLSLKKADHTDYIKKLTVWLEEPEHEHIEQYTAGDQPVLVCERCGVSLETQSALV